VIGAITLASFIERARSILDLIAEADAQGYNPDPALYADQFAQLKSLVTAQGPRLGDLAEGDPAFETLAERSRTLYARFYCHSEARACLRTIVSLTATDPLAFRSNNDALAIAEAEATQLGPSSTLAFVGCGSFPWSVLRYRALAGCHVTGVDFNSLAIHLAQEAIDALDLRLGVRLIEADARNVDYAHYSHVVVAGMASPKTAICQRVAETASPRAQLVIRSARGLNRMFYEGYEPVAATTVRAYLQPTDGRGELESWIISVGNEPVSAHRRAA
jgi:hypothetical protein